MHKSLQIFAYIAGFVAFNSGILHAQGNCPSDSIYNYRMKYDSVFRYNQLELEEDIADIIQGEEESNGFLQTPVYNIPVVVHIIHKGEAIGTGSNISDSLVIAAIQCLNRRFRNHNTAGVDMELNFQLAIRDTNGNATTGIVRVNGTVVPNYLTGGINYVYNTNCANEQLVKNLSKWPTRSYLNIWVVHKLCGGLALGYGTSQTGSAYDGVTIGAASVNGSSILLSHEVGHMFNLFHTFNGDGVNHNVCPQDTFCAEDGDRVCDTPPHKQNDTNVTNPCTPAGIWANSRYNIMSYNWTISGAINSNNCRFTKGQKARARAVLLTVSNRPYLSSKGLFPLTTVDAGIETFIYPLPTTYSTNCTYPNGLSPIVKLKNYGTNTLASVTINYRLDLGTIHTFLWSGNLLPDSFIQVTLPPISVSQGPHTFLAYTTGPNGVSDGFGLNDSADCGFNYKSPKVFSLSGTTTNVSSWGGNDGSATVNITPKVEIKEDWEGTHDWTIVNGAETNHWVVGSATANGGNKCIYISKNDTTNAYDIYSTSIVHFYKDISFPAGATNIKIKFDWKGMGEFSNVPGGVDRMRVYLKSVNEIVQPFNQIANPYLGSYFLQPTFRTDSIMGLDSIAGSSKRLIFSWRNNYDLGIQSPIAIDNISISYQIPTLSTYNYSWSTNPVQTSATATGLSASNYTATVTDNNGCQESIVLNVAQPLPVKLAYFNGFVSGHHAILNWQTASESNNNGFEIQSSSDTVLWNKIGFVNGNGNSDVSQSYSFTNQHVFVHHKEMYYRFKQVDFNHNYLFSNVIKLSKNDEENSTISILPNPNKGVLSIELLGFDANNTYDLKMWSTAGELVLNHLIVTPKSALELNLKKGIYFYKITKGQTQLKNGKLLVE